MTEAIAIVGMACCYPDARSPDELWENVLAERRAFRQIPNQRLRLADYYSADREAPDQTYSSEGCFIEGYEFDRERFRVSGGTFRAADLAHWLALDVAARSLDDARFPSGEGLPKESTGVYLGNTLTGEFSRSNGLRLRWPYVRRVLEASLHEQGCPPDQQRALLARCEEIYKSPFPAISEETLAGNLSNTIAGRICNHFDLKGGGYTVDGACASSLLAVATACSGLAAGDIDVALAGGVDLSLDPFELVGFAKAGALAAGQMRVYDSLSSGFLPGEGCGFIVLMRLQDALAHTSRIYAVIKGWGISSDGSGGITRPEVEGQMLALGRAYKRAGFGIDTVGYFEGHGTGTSIGDATEVKALTLAHNNGDRAIPAVIGSVKANIGHTKAAAGMAGLIKAAKAVQAQILPPTTGCHISIPELWSKGSTLKVLRKGEIWPAGTALRAGVSAMGFGGINTHVVIESATEERRDDISRTEQELLSSSQDIELFLLSSPNQKELLERVEHLLTFASRLSCAEMGDLAAVMGKEVRENADSSRAGLRAAVVARTPSNLASRLEILKSWLNDGSSARIGAKTGVFVGSGAGRIGFLFPGQASPVYLDGGVFSHRFDSVQKRYSMSELPNRGATSTAEVTQRAIVTASIAGMDLLERLGISAEVAVGHSLGEVAALRWAGAIDDRTCLRIASARAAAMNSTKSPLGGMAAVTASQQEVEALLNGDPLVIACLNSPRQTVVSGASLAVDRFVARVRASGFSATALSVSHAFHSPLLESAEPVLAGYLSREEFNPLRRRVASTVTGSLLSSRVDLRRLLYQQLVAPVRFLEAMSTAHEHADLFIEVGPGRLLSGLVSEFSERPVIPLDMGGDSLEGLLLAVGAAYVTGADVDSSVLFADRFTRPFDIDWRPRFFTNPCELAPVTISCLEPQPKPFRRDAPTPDPAPDVVLSERPRSQSAQTENVLELVRHLVAGRTELPSTAVRDEDRFLGDLHLNSITVSQLVSEAARHLGLPPPISPTDYSNARVVDVARALEELARTGSSSRKNDQFPAGIDQWTRCFEITLVEQPRSSRSLLSGESDWKLFAYPHDAFADKLSQAFRSCPGTGVVVSLPAEVDESHIGLLLDGARDAISNKRARTFVLVQRGRGASSFARTLHLEAPWLTTCVVNVPVDHPSAVEWVIEEARAANTYTEAHYDSSGKRRVPVLRLLESPGTPGVTSLNSSDLILVSGGGKGIAAESALSLARESGARLALLGRSEAAADAELRSNLERFAKMGIAFRYFAVDVTDPEAVRDAVVRAEAEFGPVTAVLHGAGANEARLIESLDEESVVRTLSPKLRGLRNMLGAIDPERLRLLVAFSSLIARTGMRGEADYALANEWLSELTQDWGTDHPHCRCLAVEWSAWSGTGMVQRLGRVDALIDQGITPIPIDEGVSILSRLVSQSTPVSVVVTGRFGAAPTLRMEQPDLPLGRFLEHPRVHYPGVELIVDSEISDETDPYLEDHVLNGDRLFPAVMALEAMAQTAMALLETSELPVFEDVIFNRPLVVPPGSRSVLRVVALVRDVDVVETAIRSDQTGFQVDHCIARCRFNVKRLDSAAPDGRQESLSLLAIKPEVDLYGGLLFHKGSFQRVRGYYRIASSGCLAQVDGASASWFGRYLSSHLVLGDPGRRDASIHSIQVCVPEALLLPVGIERLLICGEGSPGLCTVEARERSRDGDLFTYDVDVRANDGSLLEKWDALRLQMVKGSSFRGAWVEPLLAPYLERRIRETFKRTDVSIAIELAGGDRRCAGDRAIQRVLGVTSPIVRRPDGKPDVHGDRAVSASHCVELTMAVAAGGQAACDVEGVVRQPASIWRDLLGPERYRLSELISELSGEGRAVASTRVWTAIECLKKAGIPPNSPLVLTSHNPEGWTILTSGQLTIATFVAPVQSAPEPFAFAVLLNRTPDR
jgi:enediyne polyketide synthase